MAAGLAAVGLVVTALLVGCRGDDPAPSGRQRPQVPVARPLVQPTVQWDSYTGRLEAIEYVEVQAKVSGYLRELLFSEGELVEQGDLLLVIDPRPFEAELRRATAGLAEAEARLREAKANLARVEAEKAQAEVNLQLRRQQFQRAEQLRLRDAIAEEDLEIRQSEMLKGEADVVAAEAAILAAKAAIATAEAGVETAESQVQTANLNVSYTEVRAPVAGRIGAREVTVGNFISGGASQATLLATIVSLDPIHCVFDADEQAFLKYARLARTGARRSSREVKNPALLALVDEDGYPHAGHMDFVDNRIDPNTGTIRGRAIFPNADGVLIPGLFARIRIPGSGRDDAVMIPDAAILSDQADRFVYVVDDSGQVSRQVVRPGVLHHGLRIIDQGLDGDQRVVLGGLQQISAGMQVDPQDESIEADLEDGLPDDYQPVPEEQWLSAGKAAAAEQASTSERQ